MISFSTENANYLLLLLLLPPRYPMSIRLLPQTIRSFSSIPSKLPRLPAVRDLVQLYGLKARSQLSQNFILDKNITDKIVRSSQTQYAPDSLVVEVGPGPGLLTRSLLDAGVQRLIAVEKDSRFLPSLHQLAEASDHRLTILHGDMLKVTPEDIQALLPAHTKPSSLHIVGNLPFGIASPLLITWLRGIYGSSDLFSLAPPASLTLMFQKEVANRLVAPVRTPGRGRLSVMTQAICDPHISYKVPARIFVPSPDVDASIVHLVPSEQRLLQGSYKHLEDLVRFCFSKRRKTLGHTLR